MKTTILSFLLICFFNVPAHAEVTEQTNDSPVIHSTNSPQVVTPQKVTDMIEGYRKSTLQCPEKIWPNYSWKGKKIVFVYAKGKHSFVWDTDDDTVTSVETTNLPPSVVGSYYEFFEHEGKKAMSLEMSQDDAFKLGSHEFFHEIAQEDWFSQNNIGTKGSFYPLSPKARYYRRMLFDNLKKAYVLGSDEALKKAKYWHEKWKTEFPNEAVTATDTYEGTPQYVETISQAIAKHGCQAHQGVLKKDMAQQVSKDFGGAFGGKFFGLDSEGYDLGGLASLLLQDKKVTGWHKRVSEGVSPLDILFENTTTVEEQER